MRFEQFFRQILDSWRFGVFFRIFFTLWPFPLPGPFRASSGLFRASSPLPVASSGLFLASFWLFFLDSPKSPKFKGPQRLHLSVHKTCVSSSFSPNSGFLAFWGLFWPLLASSGPLPGLFWPLPGLFLDFSWVLQNLQNSGAPRDVIYLFIKHCVSSSFSPNSGFLAFWGLLASSWPLLAFSWPFPGLFRASSGLFLASSCPLLASFKLFPRLCKISKIQALPETLFSVHKTLCFEQFFP